ncbi:uncharacterized protein METZ01_LOCUS396533, partial [marine metagenome]
VEHLTMTRRERSKQVCLLLALACAMTSADVIAEPYIALREGLKCSTCHVNHTGGGMRSGYGALFTQTEITPLFEAMSNAALDFSADLGPSISIGADFIATNETVAGYRMTYKAISSRPVNARYQVDLQDDDGNKRIHTSYHTTAAAAEAEALTIWSGGADRQNTFKAISSRPV